MKTTVETTHLKNALSRIAQVPGAKSNVFESGLVKIAASDFGGLTLTRFTTESIVITQCEADVQEPGEKIFSLEKLSKFTSAAAKGIEFNSRNLTSGRKTVLFSEIESAIVPPEAEDGVKMLEITAGELGRWIEVCGPAMADEGLNRPALCGLIMQAVDGKLWIYGTDGRRIHAIKTERDTPEINVVIPAESIRCIEKIVNMEARESIVKFGIGERQIALKTDTTELRSPLIESKPPSKLCQLFACASPAGEFEVGKEDIADALKTGAHFGLDDQRFIDLKLGAAEMEIQAQNKEGDKYKQQVELKARPVISGNLVKFRCGASYLSDALSCIGEVSEVKLLFTDNGTACHMGIGDVSIKVMGVNDASKDKKEDKK